MKILKILFTTAFMLTIGCNQNQDAYRVDESKGSNEAPPPDPRADAMWGHDVAAAISKSKKNGTLVLMDFTGSDWCPPCMALHDFVLTQPEFLDFAEKNLELVELDFPQNKSIDEKLAETNKKLAEKKIFKILFKKNINLICLAGFMKILSKNFIKKFKGKIINIHPSLLPKYKGLNTHKKAIENNDKYAGCSVHFVTAKIDSGKIIMQKKVKIKKNDTVDSLSKKVLKKEHLLYPAAIKKIYN